MIEIRGAEIRANLFQNRITLQSTPHQDEASKNKSALPLLNTFRPTGPFLAPKLIILIN